MITEEEIADIKAFELGKSLVHLVIAEDRLGEPVILTHVPVLSYRTNQVIELGDWLASDDPNTIVMLVEDEADRG